MILILLPCLVYLACIGILSFVAGRLLPKKWFDPQSFPYRTLPFEKDGSIYRKIGIHKWQHHIPDMSRILPGLMPPKAIPGKPTIAELDIMVKETCVAECIHGILLLAGFVCLRLWRGVGGIIVALLYALGNLPFILVQRYNRPRLQRLRNRLRAKEASA